LQFDLRGALRAEPGALGQLGAELDDEIFSR